ncbi:hypothetical protein [Paraburkholderia lycopersici]|uniref:Uncharacterized protein n=1 Tax=Paraburkholderia lycopersici TaxID=416944 RepID=A0A1G7CR84_9BURK|nr:hypothetical protein [Paraburkholderia lycopersici]SDE41015.1 hypothetical protein SAMN05421548_1472 [Paraburkholderia lycopersici]
MQSLTQLAGTLPRDHTFREFVSTFTPHIDFVTEEQAAEFIRLVCEVDSRSELATNQEAAWRFHEYLRKPYIAWRKECARKH